MRETGFSFGDEAKTPQCRLTPKEAWDNLADAVVLQAAEDYREACCVLRKRPKNLNAANKKAEVECFFRSEDFPVFTAVPGEVILQMLEKEEEERKAEEERKKQEELKKQEEQNERERISGAVQQENVSDRSLAGQNCRNARLRRKVHIRA